MRIVWYICVQYYKHIKLNINASHSQQISADHYRVSAQNLLQRYTASVSCQVVNTAAVPTCEICLQNLLAKSLGTSSTSACMCEGLEGGGFGRGGGGLWCPSVLCWFWVLVSLLSQETFRWKWLNFLLTDIPHQDQGRWSSSFSQSWFKYCLSVRVLMLGKLLSYIRWLRGLSSTFFSVIWSSLWTKAIFFCRKCLEKNSVSPASRCLICIQKKFCSSKWKTKTCTTYMRFLWHYKWLQHLATKEKHTHKIQPHTLCLKICI